VSKVVTIPAADILLGTCALVVRREARSCEELSHFPQAPSLLSPCLHPCPWACVNVFCTALLTHGQAGLMRPTWGSDGLVLECVGMICACICISYCYILCAELLEPSEMFGASDSWLSTGVVEQYTKACRSERQHLFVLCPSAASSVCTPACFTFCFATYLKLRGGVCFVACCSTCLFPSSSSVEPQAVRLFICYLYTQACCTATDAISFVLHCCY
jgi:hypothetical protein